MVKYPLVTFCRMPNWKTYLAWKNAESCGQLRYPYFLSYLEDCLESNENSNKPVIEILNKISYNTEDYLNHFMIKPYYGENNVFNENTPWDVNFWSKYKENITSFHYHYNYGHCLTIDISTISKNNGKFPFTYGSEKMKLYLDVIEHTQMANYFFLHHNTDTGQFDQNMRGIQYYGHDSDTFDVITYYYIFILVIHT